MSEDHRISVWLDERNAIYRLGLAAALRASDVVLVGESAGFSPRPELAGVDVLLFGVEDLTGALAVISGTETRLVAVAEEIDEEAVIAAVEGGVTGVVIRADIGPEALRRTLRSVVNGNAALPAAVLLKVSRGGGVRRRHPGALTPRELDVLRLVARGGSTREIARDLCYAEKTVKNIIHDLLVRLSCRNRAEAVALATREGMI